MDVQKDKPCSKPVSLRIDQYLPNKEAILKHFGIGATWDYALPQSWFDDFMDRTGINPASYFVWLYREGSAIGEPFPISPVGMALHEIYKAARENDCTVKVEGMEG